MSHRSILARPRDLVRDLVPDAVRPAPPAATPRGAKAVLAGLAVAGLVTLAGCGEQPDPGADRGPDPAASPATVDAAPGGDGEEQAPGWRQSTLGKAMDRAEQVVDDIEEHDRRRMDLIDEMNGREPRGDEDRGEGDGTGDDGDRR